jgi:hypothetical protein
LQQQQQQLQKLQQRHVLAGSISILRSSAHSATAAVHHCSFALPGMPCCIRCSRTAHSTCCCCCCRQHRYRRPPRRGLLAGRCLDVGVCRHCGPAVGPALVLNARQDAVG